MDKVDAGFLRSRGEHDGPSPAYDWDGLDQDLNINQRVAQFLTLMQRVDESAGGLRTLAAPEVREIVSSALGVCGFVNPNETREVIDTVLEVLENRERVPEVASADSSPLPRN